MFEPALATARSNLPSPLKSPTAALFGRLPTAKFSTLPVGREVSIKIFAESEWFAATAKVVYELPNVAMGLAFEEVSLKSGAILCQWLLKASGGPERL
jgi:hypothetical protein